jgi:hypothetical protein
MKLRWPFVALGAVALVPATATANPNLVVPAAGISQRLGAGLSVMTEGTTIRGRKEAEC